MGVPFFYSWIVQRYPFIKQEIYKNMPYIDCLYMDLNCIIYKCVKDESTFLKEFINAQEFDEIWANIINALNNLVNLIQPRKMIFFTFDGVAPRAKMNHQRNRRFKSAKSHSETISLTENLSQNGMDFSGETFINNSISPGTHFMNELNKAMKFFIQRKLQEDDKWKHLKVVYSGSDVAGEGEHKIFDLIRQLNEKNHLNENDTHCIYGNDADLIMLSLCSHLKNICILRETFIFKKKFCHGAKRFQEPPAWEVVNVNVIRDCLEIEFFDVKQKMEKNSFKLKNIIDDFIFICFFIGNDFVPKMFCFDIRKGYLEKLLDMFKEFLIETNGYLLQDNRINFKNLEKFVKKLSEWELDLIGDKVSHSRAVVEDNQKFEESSSEDEVLVLPEEEFKKEVSNENPPENIQTIPNQSSEIINKKGLKKNLDFLESFLKKYYENRLTAKSFYYEEKLKFSSNEEGIKKIYDLLKKYMEGIQFVLRYYFDGCPSWDWYYPYYYAPMISDVYEYLKYMNENNLKSFEFVYGKPFDAFKQLILIMPSGSIDLLPDEFSHLLMNPNSMLRNPIDYYPTNFEIDPNDAYFESEFIAILPFLEEELLEKAYRSVDQSQMKEEVKERNRIGKNVVYSYKKKGDKIAISSFLIKFCPDFEGKINKTEFLFEDFKNDISFLQFTPNPKEEKMRNLCKYRLPTLKFLPSLHGKLKKNPKKPLYDTLSIRLGNQTMKEDECILLLKKNVFFVSPSYFDRLTLYEGEVIGFINPDFLHSIKNIHSVNYDKRYHQDIFWKLSKDVEYEYSKLNIKTEKPFLMLFFIQQKNYYGRKNNGDLAYEIKEFVVPTQMVQNIKLWPYFDDVLTPKLNQNEIPLGSKVIILKHPTYMGCFGKIIGKGDKNQIRIRVKASSINQMVFVEQKEKQKNYLHIKEISEMLKIELQTILIILDSLIVELDPKSDLGEKFGKQLDIGLNLINVKMFQIVPELVICRKLEDGKAPMKRYFEILELSVEAVELLKKYQINFPNIVSYINTRPKFYYTAKEFSTNKEGLDANKEIIKIYGWLLREKTSNLAQVPINSKVLSRDEIAMLEKSSGKTLSKSEKIEIEMDPHNIFIENHNNYIPPFYKEHPTYHKLKDRVVSLNTKGFNFPPFGSMGIIIGILDRSIEVLFDEPFIGGSNLGGRCNYLRGCLMEFVDVFNMTRWPEFLEGNKMKSWNYWVKPYVPKFYAKIVHGNEMLMNDSNNPYFNPFNTLQPKENQQKPKIVLKNNKKQEIENDQKKMMKITGKETNNSDNSKEDIAKQILQTVKPNEQIPTDKQNLGDQPNYSMKTTNADNSVITHPPMCKEDIAKQILQTVKPNEQIPTDKQNLGDEPNYSMKTTNATDQNMSNPKKKPLKFTAAEFKPPEK